MSRVPTGSCKAVKYVPLPMIVFSKLLIQLVRVAWPSVCLSLLLGAFGSAKSALASSVSMLGSKEVSGTTP